MWILGSTTNKPSSSAASSAVKATCCLIVIGCGLVSYWNAAESKPLHTIRSGDISKAWSDEITAAASVQSETVRTKSTFVMVGWKVSQSHLERSPLTYTHRFSLFFSFIMYASNQIKSNYGVSCDCLFVLDHNICRSSNHLSSKALSAKLSTVKR